MNKLGFYLYNIIFWISRIVTISIFGICFFAVLNAKYVLSEKFFTLFNFDVDTLPCYIDKHCFNFLKDYFHVNFFLCEHYEYEIYKSFCINSQNVDILIYAFFSILLICFIIKHIIKESKLILSIILEILAIYFLIYMFNRNINMLLISLISVIIFIVIYSLNRYLPLQKIIMIFPIIGEICCINKIISFIIKRNQKSVLYVLIIALLLSNMICILIHVNTHKDSINLITLEQPYSIRPYTHSIIPYKDKLVISGYNELIVIDKNGHDAHIENSRFGKLEEIIIDKNKEEIIVPNMFTGVFLVLDANTLTIKKEIDLRQYLYENNRDMLRICFDDEYSKIFMILEFSKLAFMIDTKNYKLIDKYYGEELNLYSDSIIYNRYRDSFLITFYQGTKFAKELNIKNNKISNIKMLGNQGYMAVSKQNKEVYISFHQQGRIGVYDAETMELKRKIKTNYTVKDITYDEDLNILIAPSYFTGNVDIFLMDGMDRLIFRTFVGYELREAKFDAKKENLYTCSKLGLYKISINIRELIKKYKNVSHETLNYNV